LPFVGLQNYSWGRHCFSIRLLVPKQLVVRDKIWDKDGTEAVVVEVRTAWRESVSEAALPAKI
jgi:hypothetical protein